MTPSFTPPPAAACSLTADPTNAKMKVAPYLLPPAAGAPAVTTIDLLKRLGTTGSFIELVGAVGLPLALVGPTTQTGFSAYRQAPTLGLARNLCVNGGFISGSHGWTLNAVTVDYVVDATSPTGYAARFIAAVSVYAGHYQDIPVEAGKAYSVAAQLRSDGAKQIYIQISWLDASGNTISSATSSLVTATAYTETTLTNQTAPGNARTVRIFAVLNGGVATAGIGFATAVRVMQQTTAPAAWTAAHQQYVSQGLAIYEAGTNLAADGDMEAVGTASYAASNATLTKDTTTFFVGAKSLKLVCTASSGYASQTGSLAAGQKVTASVRIKGGDSQAGGTTIRFVSTPSGAAIDAGTFGPYADWTAIRITGTIAGGDTGWRVDVVGGLNTSVTYFDNLAIENKAYDTMNADPSGQAFALAGRVATLLTPPVPSTFDLTDWAAAGAMRLDHTTLPAINRIALGVQVDANNRFLVFILLATTTLRFFFNRAGVVETVDLALSFVAGDTIAWGVKKSSAGMTVYGSVNGAAVTQTVDTSLASKLSLAGTVTLDLGGGAPSNGLIDGTIGVSRILKGGLSDATISAIVAAPYQDPTDNDLTVWNFNGQTYQIPAFDDHLVKLGKAYDWRCDTTAANGALASGLTTTGTVAALADAVWLKVPSDPTKNYKFPVKYEEGIHKNYPRRMSLLEPLSGPAKIATLGPNAYGAEAIKLRAIVDGAAGHDVLEAQLLALLNLTADLWLQDLFGGLRKVRFPNLDVHEFPLWQWNELTLVEVQ
jgi:hypothetical protein